LEEPWRVVSVEIKDEEMSVEIIVEWAESYNAVCPECHRACAYDEQDDPDMLPRAAKRFAKSME
jgi:hypothetical protein